MKIKKVNNTFLDVKVRTYTPEIKLAYELVETTARTMRCIDRSVMGDRYACEFVFHEKKDVIDEICTTINDLRVAKLPIIVSECEEGYFGENIDYSQDIPCAIFSIGTLKNTSFHAYEYTLTLVADTESLGFVGTSALPQDLRCLHHDYEVATTYNFVLNETYFRNNYFADFEEDSYLFTGNYSMKNDELIQLLNFHKYQRGFTFSANESDFGVSGMFGPQVSGTTHNMIIQSITYEPISPIFNNVKMEMIKQ